MTPRLLVATATIAIAAVATSETLGAQTPVTLSLGSAARMAAELGAGAEGARLRAAQAEARVRQRRADLLPSVSVTVSENERTFNSAGLGISFNDPSSGRMLFAPDGERLGPVKSWDARGALRQNVLDPAAIARLRAARAGAAAGNAEAAAVAEQAAGFAAAAYVRSLRADAQIAARTADSTLAAELLVIAQAQLAAGVGVALDVTRAQAQLSTMRSQLIMARAERESARVELVRAIGLPAGTALALTDSLAAMPAQTVVARPLALRPDLAAAAAQAAAAGRLARATRAEALPSLAFYADHGANGKATQHLLGTYAWGIQLSVPVFDGFRRSGRAEEQQLAARELDIRLREMEARAAADSSVALLQWRAAMELLDASLERVRLAELELGQARDRFSAGVTGNADVIAASLALNGARTQLIDARAALQGARVAVARAQGSVTELP